MVNLSGLWNAKRIELFHSCECCGSGHLTKMESSSPVWLWSWSLLLFPNNKNKESENISSKDSKAGHSYSIELHAFLQLHYQIYSTSETFYALIWILPFLLRLSLRFPTSRRVHFHNFVLLLASSSLEPICIGDL